MRLNNYIYWAGWSARIDDLGFRIVLLTAPKPLIDQPAHTPTT